MTEFSAKVIAILKKVPRGKVATYAQIAALSGRPNAIRGVVWILNSSSKAHKLPWQRILNSKGKIAFEVGSRSFLRQKSLLQKEGIVVDSSGKLDLKKYQWKKKIKKPGGGTPGFGGW
jgi:methylated-DNA-protein-cysteine methyltransferase-like protein